MSEYTRREAIKFFGLDKVKFEQTLREMGLNPTMEEIDTMMDEMNKDAHIENQEEILSRENDVITQSLIDALYVFQDENTITKTDFQKILNYGNKKNPILTQDDQKFILSTVQNNIVWERYVKRNLSKSDFIHSLKVD